MIWPCIFKVKYEICYISALNGPMAMKRKTNISIGLYYISTKNGLIATKRKANILIKLKASNVTIRFDLGHDLDLEFSTSNMEFAISQPKVVWLPWNGKQTCRLNSNMTNGFDLGHNLDLWIFKVKCDLDLWPHPWPSPRILMVKFWNICISEWEGQFTLNKGVGEGLSWPWPWSFVDQNQV